MQWNFKDRIAVSGVTMLAIGVALLVFTFVSAYGFLSQNLSIITSDDLVQTFGEALAPLIATSIRIMYLGVMGWIASIITIRGVTILTSMQKTESIMPAGPITNQQTKTSQKAKKGQPQNEPPASEPIVIPPEEAPQIHQPQSESV